MAYPPLKIYYFPRKHYEIGIVSVNSTGGIFKIYSEEKTIADLFRYRQKIGDDIVLESLKNYLAKKKKNINLLLERAEFRGVQKQMLPYIKAMMI